MNLIKCEIATLRKWIANRDSRSLNSMAGNVWKIILKISKMVKLCTGLDGIGTRILKAGSPVLSIYLFGTNFQSEFIKYWLCNIYT